MNIVKVESDVTRLQLDSEYCICMNISFQLFQGNSEFIASHGHQDARFNSLLSDCTEVIKTPDPNNTYKNGLGDIFSLSEVEVLLTNGTLYLGKVK